MGRPLLQEVNLQNPDQEACAVGLDSQIQSSTGYEFLPRTLPLVMANCHQTGHSARWAEQPSFLSV